MKTIQISLLTCLLLLFNESCKKSDSATSSTQSLHFEIGQNYQGGLIAYIDQTGQHGIIASLDNMDKIGWVSNWRIMPYIGATGTSIGTGLFNTQKIINNAVDTGRTAAKICNEYSYEGYNDWYLPSFEELRQLYIHKSVLSLNSANYWSSSEIDTISAYTLDMTTGSKIDSDKSYKYYVRPIRNF